MTAERDMRVDIDFMASAFGVTATSTAFESQKPLTMRDIEEAIHALESIPRPKDFTAAELQSLLRQVLIECLRLKQQVKRLQPNPESGA